MRLFAADHLIEDPGKGDVHQNRPETDRKQERGFHFKTDREHNQDQSDREHDNALPAQFLK